MVASIGALRFFLGTLPTSPLTQAVLLVLTSIAQAHTHLRAVCQTNQAVQLRALLRRLAFIGIQHDLRLLPINGRRAREDGPKVKGSEVRDRGQRAVGYFFRMLTTTTRRIDASQFGH
jgi:hypothetical protein